MSVPQCQFFPSLSSVYPGSPPWIWEPPKKPSPRPGNCLTPTLVVQAIHSLTLALRRGHGWSREGATPTQASSASFLSWVAGLGLGLWPDLTPKSLS